MLQSELINDSEKEIRGKVHTEVYPMYFIGSLL